MTSETTGNYSRKGKQGNGKSGNSEEIEALLF